MAALIPFLVFCQALGAGIGVFTVVWGELAYLRAMQDGRVSAAERAHLNIIAHGLRFGMTILLLASLALVALAYALAEPVQPAMTASYWIFVAFALLVTGVSWALSRRHVSFALGSAAIFTGWWFLLYLALGRLMLSFGAALALYVVLTAVMYGFLRAVRLSYPHLFGKV